MSTTNTTTAVPSIIPTVAPVAEEQPAEKTKSEETTPIKSITVPAPAGSITTEEKEAQDKAPVGHDVTKTSVANANVA